MIWDGRMADRVHRVSYKLHCGPIPEGSVVRHRCDIPSCINPDHLEIGTQLNNIADREDRQRTARGVNCSKTVLTEEQVLEIRASKVATRFLAQKYGVSKSTIRHTRNGRYWKHLS
jgi:hypothetical protein